MEAMTTAEPLGNPSLTRRWLGELYGNADGWLTLFAVDRHTAEQHVRWQPAANLDDLAAAALELTATCCVWFGVATRTKRTTGRGGAKDCAAIPGLWLDIDVLGPNHATEDLPTTLVEARQLLDDYPLPPTAVVATGGGIQAWWLFHEPLRADIDTAALLRRWGHTWAEHGRVRGWHVDNVFDLARIMRLPGTINHKSTPTSVHLDDADFTRRYNPDDLDQYTVELPPPPTPTTLERIPYIGPERPGDAFNASRTGTDVLNLIGGFTHVKRDTQGDHYLYSGSKGPTSATVYHDGHTTIWSETFASRYPAVEVRRPYDPFGLYCAALHDGDWRAARLALADAGYGARDMDRDDLSWIDAVQRPANSTPSSRFANLLINWPTFWDKDHASEEWIARPLIPARRQVALYAPAKTGKSILTLAVVAAVATGRPCLGGEAQDPVDVLYLDYEMTEADLYERLETLGYGPDHDLSRLHYWSLPTGIDALNTPTGCNDLVELALDVHASLVVIDTMGRAVRGEENDADSYRAFASLTGLYLKRAGCAVLRTDHAGKDKDRGQRGSSAKNDDVDVVFRLDAIEQGYVLQRTHTRIGWVPERSIVHRVEDDDNIVNFIIKGNERAYATGTASLVADLERLGVPPTASRREVGRVLREAGIKASAKRIGDAIAWRRTQQQNDLTKWCGSTAEWFGTTSDDPEPPSTRTATTDKPENRRSEGVGTTTGTTQNHGNHEAERTGTTGPPYKGARVPTPEPDSTQRPPGWSLFGDTDEP